MCAPVFIVIKRDKKYELAFGRHVRKLRDERNWSQGQLAAQAEMSSQQVSRIERGTHAVTLHTIKALAVALGKYPDELLRFQYDIKLNTDFGPVTRKKVHPPAYETIIKLVDTGFMATPRSVSEIIAKCQEEFNVTLRSSAVSGILTKLIHSKLLKRRSSPHRSGAFLYQERRK